MTPEQRAIASQILWMNLAEYWHEVDTNDGRDAARFYTHDGVMHGDGNSFVGREAIDGFYQWRIGRGSRLSRHVVTNFRAVFHDDRTATSNCVMLLYAADGEAVLPSEPAIMIADLIDECVKGEDDMWRYSSRRFVPLFKSATPATMPPRQWFDAQAGAGQPR